MKRSKYSYAIHINWSDEDKLFIAEVPELEGCMTHGATPAEAARHVEQAIETWIMAARRLKHPIPEPIAKRRMSGKFNVRLPIQLHRELVLRALAEKVSLNHLISMLVSR